MSAETKQLFLKKLQDYAWNTTSLNSAAGVAYDVLARSDEQEYPSILEGVVLGLVEMYDRLWKQLLDSYAMRVTPLVVIRPPLKMELGLETTGEASGTSGPSGAAPGSSQ
jgi:hypothetical protein